MDKKEAFFDPMEVSQKAREVMVPKKTAPFSLPFFR